MSISPPKKIFDRLCKPKDSDKRIKKTYLCSNGNELLNFFPLCVCMSVCVFSIKNDFKLEINQKMFYYESKTKEYRVTV